MEFATAVGEIAANIIRHALPASTEEAGFQLQLRLYLSRVEAEFTDRGLPFDAGAEAPHTTPDAGALWEHGYGLALARAALDELRYERGDSGCNTWRLIKRLPAPRAGVPRTDPDAG